MKKKVFLIIITAMISFGVNAQWVDVNLGTGRFLDKVAFPSANVAYIVPLKGPLFRTFNGGLSWDSLSTVPLGGTWLYRNDISFVNDSMGFITTDAKLYKTSNMGKSWMDAGPVGISGSIKVDFINEQIGFLYAYHGFSDGLWITNDGGKNWKNQPVDFSLGSGTSSLPDMTFLDENTGYLIGGDGTFAYKGVIARTTDAGKNWSLITLPSWNTLIQAHHFPNKDTGYVLTRRGDIYRTINDGTSWDSISTLSSSTESEIYFTGGKTGYIVSDSTLFKTTDAGINWSVEYTAQNGITLNSINFANKTTGLVVGSDGTVIKTSGTTNINNSNAQVSSIKCTLYPNPFSTSAFLKTEVALKNATVSIYNIQGREVKTMNNLSGYQFTISKDNIPNGLYFYKIIQDNSLIAAGKIVAE